MLVAAITVFLAILRRSRPVFELLAGHLRRLGIKVGPAMTMAEALEELRSVHPQAAVALQPLIELYEAERFSRGADPARAADLRRRLAGLKA
jgi:hypothetical protein